MDDLDLPRPTVDALRAHEDLTTQLREWAGEVHHLVWDRIDTLTAACGGEYPGQETTEEYVARVWARSGQPFPRGISIHEDLNDNRDYDHVRVEHGRVFYGGHYTLWNDDESGPDRRYAEIDVPTWVITDPDGIDRYRAETDQIAAHIRTENTALDARIDALVEQSIAERTQSQGK